MSMISVIVPAHNEEKLIERCLRSIERQQFRDFEIITVCNACTDRTAEIAKRHSMVIELRELGVSRSRNAGARRAKGNILCFIDADSYMSRNLLMEVRHAVDKGSVGGTAMTFPDDNRLSSRLFWYAGNFLNIFFLLPHGFFFCRRDQYTPFDERLKVCEDSSFLNRLKKKGKLKLIRRAYIRTSMRRFYEQGFIRPVLDILTGFFFRKGQRYRVVR